MIRCNLDKILTERRIKISKVSEDLNISRTTLSALRDNRGNGVFFDTIDSLCRYLDVTPSEFFDYVPVSIHVLHVDCFVGLYTEENKIYQAAIEIRQPYDKLPHVCKLALYMDIDKYLSFEDNWLDIQISLPPKTTALVERSRGLFNEEEATEYHNQGIENIKNAFGIFTEPFIHDFENETIDRITQRFLANKKPRFFRFHWDKSIFEK